MNFGLKQSNLTNGVLVGVSVSAADYFYLKRPVSIKSFAIYTAAGVLADMFIKAQLATAVGSISSALPGVQK